MAPAVRRRCSCAAAELVQEWKSMGGADCGSCTLCGPSSEYDLVKLIGQDKAGAVPFGSTAQRSQDVLADAAFQKHYETWFAQADVDTIKANGLSALLRADWVRTDRVDHVRIPIGGEGSRR